MSIRRKTHTTNPTNIIKIPKEDITIRLDANSPEAIKCQIVKLPDFNTMGLPSDSAVTVWANCGQTSVPIECGTVGECTPPDGMVLLEGIDGGGHISFRIIIWENGTKKILASNERINATKDGQIGILPVFPRDIGEEIWKLHLAENDPPELFVNIKIPNIKELLKNDPKVRGAVLPSVIRQILIHLNYSAFDDSDPDAWQNDWRLWLKERGEDDPLPVDEDPNSSYYTICSWADRVVEKFAKEHNCAKHIILEDGEVYGQ